MSKCETPEALEMINKLFEKDDCHQDLNDPSWAEIKPDMETLRLLHELIGTNIRWAHPEEGHPDFGSAILLVRKWLRQMMELGEHRPIFDHKGADIPWVETDEETPA